MDYRVHEVNHYCFVVAYSLQNDIPSKHLQSYLRSFDEDELKAAYQKHPAQPLIIQGQIIQTTWIRPSELKPRLFNHFDEKLKKQEGKGEEIDLQNQQQYLDFLTCKETLLDPTPFDYKESFGKIGIDFYEEFRNSDTARTYNQNLLLVALQDPDALVRLRVSCRASRVQYYSKKYKVFFEISSYNYTAFDISLNPAC